MVLCLIATREWFIRFCIPPKNLGDPGSSRGTLERVRVDLTVYIYHTYLVNENPSGLHNSLNPRPKLLAGINDDLPVKVGHNI